MQNIHSLTALWGGLSSCVKIYDDNQNHIQRIYSPRSAKVMHASDVVSGVEFPWQCLGSNFRLQA